MSACPCRVSVKGKVQEGPNPTQAWAGIFDGPDKPRGFSGLRLFGLSLPQVSQLLQQLPNAGHCSKYTGWKGTPPEIPPLVSSMRKLVSALCPSGLLGVCAGHFGAAPLPVRCCALSC